MIASPNNLQYKNMKPGAIAFDDYAALEEGTAREFIGSNMLTPLTRISSNGNLMFERERIQLCKLTRPEKNVFLLHDEASGQHLLSAKRSDDENGGYLISSYEANAPICQNTSSSSAIVRRFGGSGRVPISYKLFLCVGNRELGIDRPQIEVWPSSTCCTGQYIRKLRIDLPPPDPEHVNISSHYAHDYSKFCRSDSASFSSGSKNMKATKQQHSPVSVLDLNQKGQVVRLRNKVPVLKNGAYSLKFARGRAKMSSSKNFLVYHDEMLRSDYETTADQAVFQLGKLGPKTFALDFRYPLSPLQAFAIALVAFDSKQVHR